ncbi:hypothetical protein C7974DRAFT_101872 [Boeremia exigua]|uniref:uncharacterized protein n=1 Tax=Boeremia exigua TaxID=749465 RepID=UPI001E8E0CA3|nr:uncharacterized protein C7974DRAFT_101872 [Boeremia exigua]KAH6642413.1 hypothetical protein C7974DRAFT_101872 [Boeremia exigua]
MDAAPALTSEGALWASTPLLAAAQLWPWHPLWAAGIWTAYGACALTSQGEAWLKPLTLSPLNAKTHQLRTVYDPSGLGNATVRAPSRNSSNSVSSNSVLVTFTSATPGSETTDITTKDDGSTSVSPNNSVGTDSAFSIDKTSPTTSLSEPIPAETPSSLDTDSASNANKTSPTTSLSEPVWAETPSSLDTTTTPSSLNAATTPSSLDTATTPNSFANVPQESYSQHRSSRGETGKEQIQDLPWGYWPTYGMLLVAVAGLVAWTLGVEISPLDTLQHAQQRGRLWFQQLYHLLFQKQVPNGATHHHEIASSRLANFIWGGRTHQTYNWRAITFIFLCTVFAIYPFWRLSSLIERLLSVTCQAILTLVNGLSQLTTCAVTTYHNPLSMDGSYQPTFVSESRTGILCRWIETAVMSFRSILLPAKSSATALQRCYTVAWDNRLSYTGYYEMAHQTGPTAAWCMRIEWLVMHYRALARQLMPWLAVPKQTLGYVRQFLGCVPFVHMLSGSLCPGWAHEINRGVCISLLRGLCILNLLAVMQWHAVPSRSRTGLQTRFVVTCLVIVPFAALAMLSWTMHFSVLQQVTTLVLALLILSPYHESLGTRWITFLRRLHVIPAITR